ncbi:MAG: hypothetical protein AAF234_01390 [Pseudomonadota bacterium]
MIKRFVLLATFLAAPVVASAEVLLPSETAPPLCEDGQVYDPNVDRCVDR